MAENNNSLLAGIISIHAPPRGATLTSATVSTDRDISIHAPPRGATRAAFLRSALFIIFQFTPLREGRELKYDE